MRCLAVVLAWVGTVLLCAGLAGAQTDPTIPFGQVLSIGFQNYYRPNSWTPMLVQIDPRGAESGAYQIRVRQLDLDRDQVAYTRDITLTAGTGQPQRFWMYFQPQAVARRDGGRGLPDADDGATVADLADALEVTLTRPDGEFVARINLTATIRSLDPAGTTETGRRLVLAVGGDGVLSEYGETTTLGLVERPQFIAVRASELPDNPIGFSAVDAIVWSGSTPPLNETRVDEAASARAVRKWVRDGGRLVILQGANWQVTQGWGELLPVRFPKMGEHQGIRQAPGLAVLAELISRGSSRRDQRRMTWASRVRRVSDSFAVGYAQAKPDAVVVETYSWPEPDGPGQTPYLVRRGYGAGLVMWVAQDLSAPGIARAIRNGWAFVWDHVLDYRNDTMVMVDLQNPDLLKPYAPAVARDLGQPILVAIEAPGRAGGLVMIAVLFFSLYWIIAGPGVYFWLYRKGKLEMNWFAFAVVAAGATLVTVAVVRITVRGPPDLRHYSVVRSAPDMPLTVESRIGLYIPRDGGQRVALGAGAEGEASYVAPYAIHPMHLNESRSTYGPLYVVPVPETEAGVGSAVVAPYRSTLKKFEARWVSPDRPAPIVGTARHVEQGRSLLTGTIQNQTGQRLRNVYVVWSTARDRTRDRITYVGQWEPGTILKLEDLSALSFTIVASSLLDNGRAAPPSISGPMVSGELALSGSRDWNRYWFSAIRTPLQLNAEFHGDAGDSTPRSIPMLSLFERLPPVENSPQMGENRVEMLRRAGRWLDISEAVSAGHLVVIAQSDSLEAPIPMPLNVQGEEVKGRGTVLYQAVIPIAPALKEGTPTTAPVQGGAEAAGGGAGRGV